MDVLAAWETLLSGEIGAFRLNLGSVKDDNGRNRHYIDNLYDTLIDRGGRMWGAPDFSGATKYLNKSNLDFNRLQGDFARSFVFAYWQKDDLILTVMLSSHDGRSVTLSIETASRKRLAIAKVSA